MTLAGTNTYIVGPLAGNAVYLIDPGPADADHVAAVRRAAEERGELAGILLTHSHADHSAAVPLLDLPLLWGAVGGGEEKDQMASAASPAPGPSKGRLVSGRGRMRPRRREPRPGREPGPAANVGPFQILPTPGHAPDHVCFLQDATCFCGDLVLGEGSSIVFPGGGGLAAYLDSLRRLRELEPTLLCPGHGPWITDPRAKIDEYIEHRLERERKLIDALGAGERSRPRLLDAAWDDVPAVLRPAAALAMDAHLEKLAAEGRLPEGIHD
jgi:glyoxylase-like metal-dependent hydrolase (beta-lactamase superfamily II)